jgi:hypothetical protein
MDWRLLSAVTLAGASFSIAAFGAFTLRAADAVPGDTSRSGPSLAAPSLTPLDVSGSAVAVRLDRGVTFVPAAPNGVTQNDAAAPAAEYPAHSGLQVAAVQEASPVLVADLPVQPDKVARPSWRHKHRVTWRIGHHARFCMVLRPCGTDRKQQVAVKHVEEHAAPKMALILGVGF